MAASPTSTAAAFKTQLLTSLKLRDGLRGVQVASTYPGDTLRPQAVYFGHTVAVVTTPVMAGTRIKRDEQYHVEVMIDVCDGSNDALRAEGAALGILGELDDCLASDATQANAGGSPQQVIAAFVDAWEARPYMDETRQGWAVILRAQVKVHARLR